MSTNRRKRTVPPNKVGLILTDSRMQNNFTQFIPEEHFTYNFPNSRSTAPQHVLQKPNIKKLKPIVYKRKDVESYLTPSLPDLIRQDMKEQLRCTMATGTTPTKLPEVKVLQNDWSTSYITPNVPQSNLNNTSKKSSINILQHQYSSSSIGTSIADTISKPRKSSNFGSNSKPRFISPTLNYSQDCADRSQLDFFERAPLWQTNQNTPNIQKMKPRSILDLGIVQSRDKAQKMVEYEKLVSEEKRQKQEMAKKYQIKINDDRQNNRDKQTESVLDPSPKKEVDLEGFLMARKVTFDYEHHRTVKVFKPLVSDYVQSLVKKNRRAMPSVL